MIDSSSLVHFEQQVAGHDKLMFTPTNDLLIVKPATKKELIFYQEAHNYPEFQDFLPECYGTIRAATEADLKLLDNSSIDDETVKVDTSLKEDLSIQNICLENVLHGFTKPCILDLKMGSLLYDEDASEEKRRRMINHSITTTSSTLGLRISGMKTFCSVDRTYGTYEKKFGKTRTPENTTEAILAFLFPCSLYGKEKTKDYRTDKDSVDEGDIIREKIPAKYMRWIIECFIDTIDEIRESIKDHANLRLIGSSLLFVYEGDKLAADKTWKYMLEEDKQGKQKAEEEEEEAEELSPKMCDIRLIDFAHSDWHAQRDTQDPELIKGFDNIIKVLRECLEVQDKEKL